MTLQLLGGRVRGVTQAAVGEQALRVLDTLRVDIAFIGTNGISARHGLSTPDSEEAAVKRAMVACANYVVVAADSTKVGREDFVSFAPISSVDTLITDAEITRRRPPATLTDHGVEVICAGSARMIVTVTPNPSIDRTVTLGTPLTRGAVHRVTSVTSEPGGKGVNVARALTLAGLDAVAVLPAADTDPIVAAPARQRRRRSSCVPITGAVRTNLTITESDGTTTKLNEPGAASRRGRAATRSPARSSTRARRRRPGWCCPARCRRGCPTTGTPTSSPCWPPLPCRVAVDTSERPLAALAAGFGRAAPDLIKPNAEELAGLVGASARGTGNTLPRRVIRSPWSLRPAS